MASSTLNRLIGAGALSSVLIISGCSGGEERQAKYLERAESYFAQENYDKARIEVKNVLQINPKHAEARYLLGMLAELDENLSVAFANFNLALELDPQHLKSLNKLAYYYVMSKDNPASLEKVNAVLAIDANNADALATLATVYASQNNTSAAIEKAQLALANQPGHVHATTVLTGLYAKGNPDLALEVIGEAIANQSRNESLKMLKVRVLHSQNKRDDVIALYKELIAEHPDKLLYYGQLVTYHLKDDRYSDAARKDTAEQILRELVAAKPRQEIVKLWLVGFQARNRSVEEGVTTLEQFVAELPDNYKLRDALAKLYISIQQNDKARTLYTQVIDADPKGVESIDARNKLAAIYLLEGDRAAGSETLQEIFELEPENSLALITRAKIKLKDKDIVAAIPDLRVVLKNDPESVEALTLLARAHEKTHTLDLALDSYQRLVQIKPDSMAGLVGMGRLLMSKNQLEAATQYLEQAKRIDDTNPELVRLLTDLYTRAQRWDEALSVVERLMEDDKTKALAYYLKGRTYLRKNDINTAVPFLEKSHQLEPRGVETLATLVEGYVALGHLSKAKKYVAAHIEKYPDQIHAKVHMGNLHGRSKDFEAALSTFKEVVDQDPGRNAAYRAIAKILASQKKLAELEAILLEGLKRKPGNDGLKLMLAGLYQTQGKNEQAVGVYEELLEGSPSALVAKNNLANLLMDYFNTPENRNKLAGITAELALTEKPAFLDTAGWAQYHLGNYPQAVDLLGAAVEKGGKGGVYHYHLGMAYFKSDRADDAKAQLELALSDKQDVFAGRSEAESTLGLL